MLAACAWAPEAPKAPNGPKCDGGNAFVLQLVYQLTDEEPGSVGSSCETDTTRASAFGPGGQQCH